MAEIKNWDTMAEPPKKQEKARSAEQEPKNDTGDLALFAKFLSDQKTIESLQKKNEFNKKALSKQADQMRQVKEIMADFSQSKTDIETALREIGESIEYYDKQATADVSDEEYDELIRQREAYEKAHQFIIQNRDRDFLTERKDFADWGKERRAERLQQQQQEEAIRQRQTAQQIEGVYKQLGVESQSEREKSRERAMEIVLADAGVNINMSVKQEMSNAAYQTGYQNLTTRINAVPRMIPAHTAVTKIENQLLASNDLMRGKKGDDVIKEHGIREIIDIRHLTKQVTEVVAQAKKGFLGFGSKKAETKYRQEPVLHNEKVVNGEREPAVQITYYIPSQRDWVDYSNRSSGMLAEIILPESKAEELSHILERDPSAMRKIVERVMKEKILANSAAWEAPQFKEDENSSLRPPYEKWDAETGGGKIYVQKEGMNPGFHEDAVHKIQK